MAEATSPGTWDFQGQVQAVEDRIDAQASKVREAKVAGADVDEPLKALMALKHEVGVRRNGGRSERLTPWLPRSRAHHQYLQLTGQYYVGKGEHKQRKRSREARDIHR